MSTTTTVTLTTHKQLRLEAFIAAGMMPIPATRAAVLSAIGREDYQGQSQAIAEDINGRK